jgi:2-polyprenyl-6-hydroxyphenyl methylase/3-demethylubiquinone-9 3-methyltransferase
MREDISKSSSSNLDESEVAKFEDMAPLWWDKEGVQKPLHDINPLRVGYIDARSPLTGKQVLDVGCGGGILSEAMAEVGAKVTGIDAAPAPLAVARMHMRESDLDIDYQWSTAEAFAAKNPNRFDIVTCLELLEHVPEPVSVVSACHRLVKPGGDVFFATLNRNLKSFIFAIIGAEYVLRIVQQGTHSYRMFIKPSELGAWARSAGLYQKDLTGLHYNPFFKTYSMGGNTHVNYMMHFRK